MGDKQLRTSHSGKRKVAILNYNGVLTAAQIEKLQVHYQERLGVPVVVLDGGVRLEFIELD